MSPSVLYFMCGKLSHLPARSGYIGLHNTQSKYRRASRAAHGIRTEAPFSLYWNPARKEPESGASPPSLIKCDLYRMGETAVTRASVIYPWWGSRSTLALRLCSLQPYVPLRAGRCESLPHRGIWHEATTGRNLHPYKPQLADLFCVSKFICLI